MRLRDRITGFSPRRLALSMLVGAATVLATAAGAAPAAASAAACTNSWNGNAGDGLWSDGANWSTGSAPVSSDVVCLPSGAGVEVDPATTNFTVAGLELDGATLTTGGSESLTVSGELDLQNATPGSSGTPDVIGSGLSLIAQGSVTVDPDLDVCLATGGALANSGTLTLGDGADLGGAGQTDCSGSTGGGVTNTGTIVSQATSTQATVDNLTSDTGSSLDGPGTLHLGSTFSLPAGSGGFVGIADQLTLQDDALTTVGANVQVCTGPNVLVTIGSSAAVALGQQSNLGDNNDSTGLCDNGTGGGSIVNQGAITASGASGMVNIDPAFFDNAGSVTVNPGTTLAVPAQSSDQGSDTGTYAIGSGATLSLSGTERDIDYGGASGTTFSGGGTLVISGGLTDFQTDADLSGLSHFTVAQGATAQVDDQLEGPAAGSSPGSAISGDLNGYGTATVAQGTSLSFTSTGAELGEDVWLINNGALSVSSGVKACIDADATLENGASGVVTLGAGAMLGANPANTNCGGGTLENDPSGAITAASGATVNTALFDNAGTVTASGGTLAIDASNQDTDTGSYSVAGSATLSIQGGAVRVLDGALSGTGRLQLSAAGGAGASLEVSPFGSVSIGSLSIASGTTLQIDGGSSTPLGGSSSPVPVTVSGVATFSANSNVAFNGDALTSPNSTETLALLSFGSHSGTPVFPPDDNNWHAAFGTIAGTPGVVATITPVPPQNQTPPTIGGSAVAGGTLTVTQGSWSGTPTHVSDQWEQCDPYGDPCTAVASGSTYSPTQNDVGNQIEVVETASNAGGSSTVDSAMTDAVTTLAPINLSPPVINGDEGTVGELLSEGPGAWQNNPSIGLQWEDCDITGTVCTPIPGATGASYTTTENDVNDSIVVVETATNAYGSAQAASDPTEPLMDLGVGGFGADPTDPTGTGTGGGRSSGAATVSVPSHTVSGTDLSIALRCSKQAACPVTITLTATEAVAGSHAHSSARGHRSRFKVVVVGSQTVRVAAGDHRTVTVSLNRTGARLLSSTHTLRTVLTASSLHTTLERTSVTFTAAASASSKSSRPKRSTTKRPSSKHTTTRRPAGATHRTKRTPRSSAHPQH